MIGMDILDIINKRKYNCKIQHPSLKCLQRQIYKHKNGYFRIFGYNKDFIKPQDALLFGLENLYYIEILSKKKNGPSITIHALEELEDRLQTYLKDSQMIKCEALEALLSQSKK